MIGDFPNTFYLRFPYCFVVDLKRILPAVLSEPNRKEISARLLETSIALLVRSIAVWRTLESELVNAPSLNPGSE